MRAHPAGPLHGNISAADRRPVAPPADLGALDPQVWPRSAAPGRRRAAPRPAAPVTELAREHGTPLFVLDEADFRSRAADFAGAFADADVHYASKAFLCGQVARWIADDGLHLDACSGNELSLALAAGFPAERIALHGNNKSLVELQLAVDAGIGHVVLDSFDEIDRLVPLAAARVAAGGAPVPVLIRADRRHRGAHPRVHRDRARGPEVRLLAGHRRRADRRGAGDPRAGAAADRPAQPHRLADLRHRRLRGGRAPGRRAARPGAPGHRRAARRAQPRRRLRHRLPGRGRPGRPRTTSPTRLRTVVAAECAALGLPVPRLAVEPGRAIAGPGTVTLYEIGTIKPVRLGAGGAPGTPLVRNYVSVDGGMSDNIRTALYDAELHLRAGQPQLRRPAGAVPRGRQALRERRHPGPRPVAALGRRRPATCSRSPRPAPTAGRWRATTTTCSSRRWSPYGTASPPRSSGVRHCPTCSPSTPSSPTCPRPRRPSTSPPPSTPSGAQLVTVTRCKVALLGCGTVGSAVLRLLDEQADDLAARIGRPVEVAGIAVRRPAHHPDVPAAPAHHRRAAAGRRGRRRPRRRGHRRHRARPQPDAGGHRGRQVGGQRQQGAAGRGRRRRCTRRPRSAGVDLYYEAAVAGAIPLLRPLRESLAGDQLRRVVGIVNGTTNYILSRMAETGAGFAEALAEATELGYAEADPTADVDGFDAAAKAAILASLAFHTPVSAGRRAPRGHLRGVGHRRRPRRRDRLHGQAAGHLRAGARPDGDGDAVAVRVHPAMIPTTHPLASVGGAFNAVFVEAEAAGQLMFYGQGAGGEPTASAVLGDLVAVARNRLAGAAGPGPDRLRRPRRPADGRHPDPLPREPRRRRQAGRAGRPSRRSSPRTTSASPPSARTGAATPPRWSSSPTARPTRRCPPPSPRCGTCPRSAASPASCASRGCHDAILPSDDLAGLARADRGLPVTGCR